VETLSVEDPFPPMPPLPSPPASSRGYCAGYLPSMDCCTPPHRLSSSGLVLRALREGRLRATPSSQGQNVPSLIPTPSHYFAFPSSVLLPSPPPSPPLLCALPHHRTYRGKKYGLSFFEKMRLDRSLGNTGTVRVVGCLKVGPSTDAPHLSPRVAKWVGCNTIGRR